VAKALWPTLYRAFYSPSSGRITLDSYDLAELTLGSLRDNIALVSQEVVLFNDTVAANIAYGQMRKVPEVEIIAAAQAAHAMEFIREMPQGLQTLWVKRECACLADSANALPLLALFSRTHQFLILDEATSALDSESRASCASRARNPNARRTTLIIAHRLSTIEKADRIVVLQKGEIVEIGTHQELLAKGDVYDSCTASSSCGMILPRQSVITNTFGT